MKKKKNHEFGSFVGIKSNDYLFENFTLVKYENSKKYIKKNWVNFLNVESHILTIDIKKRCRLSFICRCKMNLK